MMVTHTCTKIILMFLEFNFYRVKNTMIQFQSVQCLGFIHRSDSSISIMTASLLARTVTWILGEPASSFYVPGSWHRPRMEDARSRGMSRLIFLFVPWIRATPGDGEHTLNFHNNIHLLHGVIASSGGCFVELRRHVYCFSAPLAATIARKRGTKQ